MTLVKHELGYVKIDAHHAGYRHHPLGEQPGRAVHLRHTIGVDDAVPDLDLSFVERYPRRIIETPDDLLADRLIAPKKYLQNLCAADDTDHVPLRIDHRQDFHVMLEHEARRGGQR